MNRLRRLFEIALLTASAAGCQSATGNVGVSPVDSAAMALAAVGRRVEPTWFRTLEGDSVLLFQASTRPIALFLLEKSDCWSCAAIPKDAWKVARWARRSGAVVTGVLATDSVAPVRRYVKATRLPFDLLIDSGSTFARRLGLTVHPALVLIAPDGTILSILWRRPALQERIDLDPFLRQFTEVRDRPNQDSLTSSSHPPARPSPG